MRRYLHLECSNDGEENEKFWRVDLNTLYFKTSSVDKLFNFDKIARSSDQLCAEIINDLVPAVLEGKKVRLISVSSDKSLGRHVLKNMTQDLLKDPMKSVCMSASTPLCYNHNSQEISTIYEPTSFLLNLDDPECQNIFFHLYLEELCNEHPDCGLHLLDLRYPPNINRDSIRKLVSASELSNDNADNPLSVAIYSLNLDRLSLEESLEFLNTLDDTNENATSKKRKFETNELLNAHKVSTEGDFELSMHEILSKVECPENVKSLCQELSEEISFLRLEKKSNADLISDQNNMISSLIDQIKESNIKIEILQNSLDKNGTYKEKCEELEAKCQQLLNDMSSVEEALMDDMARINSENEELKENLRLKTTMLESKECYQCLKVSEQIDSIYEAMLLLEAEASRAPKQSDLDNLEIEYQKKIDVMIVEKNELNEKIDSLQNELKIRGNDIIELMEKLSNTKKNERNIEEKFELQISNLEQELNSARTQLTQYEQMKTTLEEEVNRISSELSIKTANNTELQSNLDQSSSDLAQLQSIRTELERSLYHKNSEMENLRTSLESVTRSLKGTETELEKLGKENFEVKDTLNISTAKISNLEAVIKELECRLVDERLLVSDFRQKNEDLQQKLAGYEENEQLQKNLLDKIEELQKELNQRDEDLSKVTEFWKTQVSALQIDHSTEFSNLRNHAKDLEASLQQAENYKLKVELLEKDVTLAMAEKEKLEILLNNNNRIKDEQFMKIEELQESIKSLEKIAADSKTSQTDKSIEVMLRIELEKAREMFKKQKRILQLKISELEEENSSKASQSNIEIDLLAKIKRLEEENFRISQLHQASLHKIDYYSTLINKSKSEAKENSVPREQAFGKM